MLYRRCYRSNWRLCRQLHKREEPYRALFLETNYPQSVCAAGTGFQLR